MIAAAILYRRCPTLRASGHLRNRLPSLEHDAAIVLAAASVPDAATLETHHLAALALSAVSAAARLADDFAAVWSRTPLKALVLAHSDIFMDDFERFYDFLGAKLLNVISLKALLALELHAWDPKGLAISYTGLQVRTGAVDAERVPARQGEEVLRQIVLVAAGTRFTPRFDWVSNNVKVILVNVNGCLFNYQFRVD